MHNNAQKHNNRIFTLVGLSVALAIGVFLSPLASQNPDGLDRVAQDFKFESKADAEALAYKLPFTAIFDEYKLRGVPQPVATPLAGLLGTIVTFTLSVGLGKLVLRSRTQSDRPESLPQEDYSKK